MAFKGAVQRWRKMLVHRVVALGHLRVGGNNAENQISEIITRDVDITTSEISAGDEETYTLTVDGVEVGDQVLVNFQQDVGALQVTAYASGEDEVKVEVSNPTDGGIEIDDSEDARVTVIKI